jgi:hypothetical protein
MEWFSALEVAKTQEIIERPTQVPSHIKKNTKPRKIQTQNSKDFQGINSSKEEVGDRSHHI